MPLSVDDVLDTYWESIEPLRNPVMLVALQGLFDIGQVATSALDWMVKERDAVVVADVDPDPFFDFTQERPHQYVDEDGERRIRWPENEFLVVRYPEGSRDLVIVNGTEPHLAWATFAACTVRVAEGLGCNLVVSLGAAAEQVPHTRVPLVVGSTTDDELASRLGLDRPRYQGPTGVAGVLLQALDAARIPCISLRVGVPHYLANAQHPKSAAALLQHLEHVLGIPTDHGGMYDEIQRWEELHDAAVDGDDQTMSYLAMLEEDYDLRTEEQVPSAEALAEEFERFLKEHEEGDDEDR